MSGFDERHHAVNGVDTAVLSAGDGDPLLFLHGGGVLEGFDCFLPLAERFRFIAPYHPGFGPSAEDPSVAGMHDWVRRQVGLLDVLDIERTVVVGHSLGGWLAARLSLDHPERVRRLVLASPAGLNVPDHPGANLRETPPAEIYKLLTSDPSIFAGLVPDPLDDAFLAARMREGESIGRVVSGPFDPVLEETLDGLRVPTLILWGEDDRIVPVGHARAWQSHLPDAEVRVFPGTGHLLFHEEPEAVGAVAAFAAA
jgi:pimeloyl-ACP methyl ester carboxylesterase